MAVLGVVHSLGELVRKVLVGDGGGLSAMSVVFPGSLAEEGAEAWLVEGVVLVGGSLEPGAGRDFERGQLAGRLELEVAVQQIVDVLGVVVSCRELELTA